MGMTLALSLLLGSGWLPVQHWMSDYALPDNPVIFHSHIAQNNMMAFAAFLALLRLRTATSFGTRAGWAAFASLGAVNVLFMVQGRTGYLILLALLAWFAWTTLARGKNLGARHAAGLLLALTSLAAAAYQLSPRLHDRVEMVVSEFQAWQPNQGKDTSTGQRLDFYYNTLQVVQQQPLSGVGTGGFPAAFAQQVQGTAALPTHNPHNEYLMVAAQTGIVGLTLLLYLFYTLWRTAPRLPGAFEQDAARGLVLAYLVNCTFNSALMDHSDGLFFAFMTAVLFANLKQEEKRD
jgi:O-antigen ligase